MCIILKMGSYCWLILPYERSSLSWQSVKRIMRSSCSFREVLYKWMCRDQNLWEWGTHSTIMQPLVLVALSNLHSVLDRYDSKALILILLKRMWWHDIFKLVHNAETNKYSQLPLKSCSENIQSSTFSIIYRHSTT